MSVAILSLVRALHSDVTLHHSPASKAGLHSPQRLQTMPVAAPALAGESSPKPARAGDITLCPTESTGHWGPTTIIIPVPAAGGAVPGAQHRW